MPRWMDLYPAWWRARYGDEMEALLHDQRPTVADRFDLALGAFDAHLHPPPALRGPSRSIRVRLATALALIGGAVWGEAVALSLMDAWDVGIVYRIAAALLVSSALCSGRGQYTALFGWGVVALGMFITSSIASSTGGWPPAYLGASLGVAIVAIVSLRMTARSVGIHGTALAALLAWGAVMPVVITTADLFTLHNSVLGGIAWLSASLLWIAAWTIVGVIGLRTTRDLDLTTVLDAR